MQDGHDALVGAMHAAWRGLRPCGSVALHVLHVPRMRTTRRMLEEDRPEPDASAREPNIWTPFVLREPSERRTL